MGNEKLEPMLKMFRHQKLKDIMIWGGSLLKTTFRLLALLTDKANSVWRVQNQPWNCTFHISCTTGKHPPNFESSVVLFLGLGWVTFSPGLLHGGTLWFPKCVSHVFPPHCQSPFFIFVDDFSWGEYILCTKRTHFHSGPFPLKSEYIKEQ